MHPRAGRGRNGLPKPHRSGVAPRRLLPKDVAMIAEARAGGRLDNKGIVFPTGTPTQWATKGSPPQKKRRDPVRRATKSQRRDIMGRLLPEESVANCGKWVSRRGGNDEPWAKIKLGSEGASWSGLVSCGSVWMCPCCASKIAAERQAEVKLAIERAQAEGLVVYMATFTVPHAKFDTCADLVRNVALRFSETIAGNAWLRAKEAAGFAGFIRSLELTHGGAGWHPHLHVLYMIRGGAEATERAADLARYLFTRWSANIARAGLGECSEKAWDFQRCDTPEQAGDYVSKWGPDYELTHGHLKEGKQGGRSPWRILADYAETGDKQDAALLIEYAEALKGHRQLTWSKGLKARFKIGELEDAEVAEKDADDAVAIVEVHEDAVRRLVKTRGAMVRALEVLEEGGVDALLKFFATFCIDGASVRLCEGARALAPPDGYERVKTMLGRHVANKVFGVEYV